MPSLNQTYILFSLKYGNYNMLIQHEPLNQSRNCIYAIALYAFSLTKVKSCFHLGKVISLSCINLC